MVDYVLLLVVVVVLLGKGKTNIVAIISIVLLS